MLYFINLDTTGNGQLLNFEEDFSMERQKFVIFFFYRLYYLYRKKVIINVKDK